MCIPIYKHTLSDTLITTKWCMVLITTSMQIHFAHLTLVPRTGLMLMFVIDYDIVNWLITLTLIRILVYRVVNFHEHCG